MTVSLEGNIIRLEGRCRIEDAEILLARLIENPGCTVDLSDCASIHTALVQLLLAFSPPLSGIPGDPTLQSWLVPLLESAGGTFEPVAVGLRNLM